MPAKFSPEPVFSLDYSIWGIEYTDGTVVELDSRIFTKLTPARIALPLFPNLTIRASFPSLERAGRHPSGALPVAHLRLFPEGSNSRLPPLMPLPHKQCRMGIASPSTRHLRKFLMPPEAP